MKILLVYKSKTGLTKKYANWINEEIDCKTINFSDLKKVNKDDYDLIIFGTRIHAGRIDGLDKIRKKDFKSLVIFLTGATPDENDAIKEIWKNNLKANEQNIIKHFYFPAGLNYEKMNFLDKTIMRLFAHILSKKKDKTNVDSEMNKAISESYDISSKSTIIPLIEYIKSL